MSKYNFNINGRVFFVFSLFLLFFLIIIVKLFFIQIVNNEKWQKLARRQYFTKTDTIGKRGEIKAYRGEELAYDIESFEINLDPTQIKKELIPDYAKFLSRELDLDYKTLKNKIEDKSGIGNRFYLVKKDILQDKKEDITQKLNNLGLHRGVYFQEDRKRIYAKPDLFQNITGFLNYDRFGVYGIELSQNKILTPKPGYEKNYVAEYYDFEVPNSEVSERLSAEDGSNIYLTIDYVMQHILFEELKKVFDESKSNWASGIIIDPNNGKIKAMVSLPVADKKKNIKNLSVSNIYEPGSVMKPVVMAMALEEGLVKDDELFYSEGQIKVYNAVIREHDSKTKGYFTPTQVISESSNVSMVKIGQRFTDSLFYKYLLDFGLHGKTGLNFPGEVSGQLQHYKKWSGLKIPTMSFGQGIAVTPLQMAMAFSTLVNGGKLYKPLLIDRIENSNGDITQTSSVEVKKQVISKEVSDKIKDMLYDTVENGTGIPAKIEGYKVAGKTGTSQKSDGPKGYASGKYQSSFAGFYPIEKPKLVCLVILDEPKGKKVYGGQLGAPVFRETFKRIVKYMDYTPEDIDKNIIDLDVSTKIEGKIEESYKYTKGYMPDLYGKSKREVLKILSEYDNEILIKGSGILRNQQPLPGKKIKPNQKIGLLFE